MKPHVSPELHSQVLDLRRKHSISNVAKMTGLPIGTVKTLVSRSGAFRDNQTHRALFTLPPIRPSKGTMPVVQEFPAQQRVTGDEEVDAVIWLREVIDTGNPALIEKAMQAKERIKTPLEELEKRYTKHLVSANPGNWTAAFASINFADLEGLAKRVIERERIRTEAVARFDDIHAETDAESFCVGVLDGVEKARDGFLNNTQVAEKFRCHPEVMPNTLSDCLHELDYWDRLYRLRNAVSGYGDPPQEAYAREQFTFSLLAEIRPRSRDEAISVFRYLVEEDRLNFNESTSILANLIGCR